MDSPTPQDFKEFLALLFNGAPCLRRAGGRSISVEIFHEWVLLTGWLNPDSPQATALLATLDRHRGPLDDCLCRSEKGQVLQASDFEFLDEPGLAEQIWSTSKE